MSKPQPISAEPKLLQFVADDVWKVARAALANAVNEDVTCGRNAYNICRHCGASNWWQENPDAIKHETTCLVHVARDLLTGAPPSDD